MSFNSTSCEYVALSIHSDHPYTPDTPSPSHVIIDPESMSLTLSRHQNPVLVVSGEKGRRDFFNAKGLDLQEGFRVLSGAVRIFTPSCPYFAQTNHTNLTTPHSTHVTPRPQLPFVTGITSDLRQKRINQIYKWLGSAQHTERLENRTCALPSSCNQFSVISTLYTHRGMRSSLAF